MQPVHTMLLHDETGPYCLVSLDELDDVRARLIELDVAFEVDEDATTCGGPVYGVLRLREPVPQERLRLALQGKR